MDQAQLRETYANQRGLQTGAPVNNTLVKLLSAFESGIDEPKKLARVINDRQKFMAFGGQSGETIKEFLTTEDLEGADLVVEEVAGTIYGGMQYHTRLRGIIPEQKVNSNSFRWPKGEAGISPMGEVGEAAEIPDEKEDFTKLTLTIKKYASKARITTEMIDDGLFSIVERELQNLGQRAALRIDALILEKLIDDGSNEHDTAGTNQDAAAVRATIAKLRGEPTYPTTHFILHPEFMTKVLADTEVTYALNFNAINPVKQQTVPELYGAKLIEFDYGTPDATETWGFATGGEIGGVAIHAPLAAGLGMNRELRLEKYKDPVKDLVGLVGSIRFDVGVLFGAAIARTEY